jgi:hypothetical protein
MLMAVYADGRMHLNPKHPHYWSSTETCQVGVYLTPMIRSTVVVTEVSIFLTYLIFEEETEIGCSEYFVSCSK